MYINICTYTLKYSLFNIEQAIFQIIIFVIYYTLVY